MMSKRFFFKAMKEDLRHKLWMLALSCLASFLAHPVLWLMNRGAAQKTAAMLETAGYTGGEQAEILLRLWGQDLLTAGSLVAAVGAVIVGLFGFRFLFHRNIVDTYHSLPVKRSALFAICYVDGFLIWVLPAMVCMLMVLFVQGSFLNELGGAEAVGGLLGLIFRCLLVCGLLFLEIYHLVLAAVMLSGNILNTLVSMLMLGFGAIGVWGLGTGFFSIYMDTFYVRSWGLKQAVYASPILSAVMMPYMLIEQMGEGLLQLWRPDVARMLLINLAVTAGLGICAWFLYRRRDSEHAEQGIRSRTAAALMRILGSVGAGMCGWLLFSMLVDEEASVWGCFGAVLAGGLVFGILDIIFQMEFKAFFAHKLQMAASITLSLLLCAAFYRDWFGYDAYLPEKEEIAEMGIYEYIYSNRNFHADVDSEEYPLEQVHLTDPELIYPYLECVTARQRDYDSAFLTGETSRLIRTKVTLKNGRSYYRIYRVPERDKELLLPLLTDEAYLAQMYLLEEEIPEDRDYRFTLIRGGRRLGTDKADREMIRSVIRAYNQDLREEPENAIIGKGRLLARVNIDPMNDLNIDVYETMERTVEALIQAGFEKWIRVREAGEIRSLELGLWSSGYKEDYSAGRLDAEGLILAARLTYGIYGGKTGEELTEEYAGALSDVWEAPLEDWEIEAETGEEDTISILITDETEINELLGLISYETPGRGCSMFQENSIQILITDESGETFPGYIQEGKLPEKYIYRFGEL